tara:strand:+ start:1603 stop:2583 length:981 start_codon:yes stop_codon:yes gene_type:complete
MFYLLFTCVVNNHSLLGNGVCNSDPSYNTYECNWDDGDCCYETCSHELCEFNIFDCKNPLYSSYQSLPILSSSDRQRRSGICTGTCEGENSQCGHRSPNFNLLSYRDQYLSCNPCGSSCDCRWHADPNEVLYNCLEMPTNSPTHQPTKSPTSSPTSLPTSSPTTPSPTRSPTRSPSKSPTRSPTTISPTKFPTYSPTVYKKPDSSESDKDKVTNKLFFIIPISVVGGIILFGLLFYVLKRKKNNSVAQDGESIENGDSVENDIYDNDNDNDSNNNNDKDNVSTRSFRAGSIEPYVNRLENHTRSDLDGDGDVNDPDFESYFAYASS